MKKILVFQTWGIGDMIMMTPMLSALRRLQPRTEITLIVSSRSALQVVQGSPLCENVLVACPGKMGALELIRMFYGFRAERFDAAIVGTRISPRISKLLRVLSRIDIIAGDCLPPRRWGYTHWCPVEPTVHRVTSNLKILSTVFPQAQTGSLHFQLDPGSCMEADRLWSQTGLDQHAVLGIHAGSSPPRDKRLPAEKFRIVIQDFLGRFPDAHVLLFFGPEDADVLPRFSGIDERVILVSDQPLRTVARLISKLRALLAGDTGLGHIAAAFGVPVVTLAGPTEVSSTKPWSNENTILRNGDLPCMP